MKKAFKLLTLLLIIVANKVSAQNDTTEKEKPRTSGYITFLLGGSVPVGQFADPNIGGAGSGAIVGVSFGLPLKNSNFGIAAKAGNSNMDQTGTPYLNAQKKVAGRYAGYLAPIGYEIDSISQYRQFHLMFGLYYTKPILKRFTIDGRLLVGINRTVKDELRMQITNLQSGYQDYLYHGGGASNNVCLDLGASFRVNLGKRQHFCIALNVDYVAAKANFNVTNYGFFEEGGALYLGPFKENINHGASAINIGVSGGFVFIKKAKK